ncbi:MAG: UTP--glucose-1-phosphate uridylyltransferase [Pirellulaceae bacterium]
MGTKEELQGHLQQVGQEHLLRHWDALTAPQRESLARQIQSLDFTALRRFVTGADDTPDWAQLAERAAPPRAIRRQIAANEISQEAARKRGNEALAAGQIGMILVAGGQGTRLGFSQPKGMFPIGPVSGRTLFQVLVDRLTAVARRHRVRIPLYVMTSTATHDETVGYFESQQWLGLDRADVYFFRQGMLPAVDRRTGQVLLSAPDELALSPDGHGGMLAALSNSGCLADARQRGVTVFFYGQVDNPLLQVCDAEFIGYHLLAGSEMTTQVVQKRFALERVGNVVDLDGKTQIIEYSDLPQTVAERTNADGSLYLWAGNTAVHAFARDFLEREAADALGLPIHRATKKVPYVGDDGQLIKPAEPNATKFERFIFDLLPRARQTIVVEVAAEEAFAPVKNAATEKVDTPETAQAAMIRRDRELLRAAGMTVPDGVAVEVHPGWAMDASDAAGRRGAARQVRAPEFFAP